MDIEILEEFRKESKQILDELNSVVESLEDPKEATYKSQLAEFAQKIDRIMGTAKTIAMIEPDHMGLKRIGQIAALCKALGYKAAEATSMELLPLFSAFWADTLEVVGELMNSLEDDAKTKKIASEFSIAIEKRLTWLSQKALAADPTKGKLSDSLSKLLEDLKTTTEK